MVGGLGGFGGEIGREVPGDLRGIHAEELFQAFGAHEEVVAPGLPGRLEDLFFVSVEPPFVELGKEVVDQIPACADRRGVDPVFAVEPAAHVGRVVEGLSHRPHAAEEARLEGHDIELQILAKAEVELDRAFDQIAPIRGVEEELALEKSPDEVVEVEFVVGPAIAECFDIGFGHFFDGEVESDQLADEEGSCSRMAEGDVDDIVAVPVARFAENRLPALDMVDF